MTALISLISFVTPLFSPRIFFYFSTIFSLNSVHQMSPFLLLVFLSCLGEKILQVFIFFFTYTVTTFTLIYSPSAVACSLNSSEFESIVFWLVLGSDLGDFL